MTASLKSAEEIVSELSSSDLAAFRKWFAEYDGRLWDKQIEEDSKAGKLDGLISQALEEYRAGKLASLAHRTSSKS